MNYSGIQFFRLTEEIEAQGGVQVDELHEVQTIDIPKQAQNAHAQPVRGQKMCGCDEAALFLLPFERLEFSEEPSDDQQVYFEMTKTYSDEGIGVVIGEEPAHHAMPIDEHADTLKVCAVDDAVGLWPRFKGTWEEN